MVINLYNYTTNGISTSMYNTPGPRCRSAIQQACLLRYGRLRKEAIKGQPQVTRYVDPPDQTNGMFLERVTEQPDLVARHLMLSGDMESNPGPVTRSQTKAQGEERHISGIRAKRYTKR